MEGPGFRSRLCQPTGQLHALGRVPSLPLHRCPEEQKATPSVCCVLTQTPTRLLLRLGLWHLREPSDAELCRLWIVSQRESSCVHRLHELQCLGKGVGSATGWRMNGCRVEIDARSQEQGFPALLVWLFIGERPTKASCRAERRPPNWQMFLLIWSKNLR